MIGAVGVAVGAAGLVDRHTRVPAALTVAVVVSMALAPIPTSAFVFLIWSVARFRRSAAARRSALAIRAEALEGGDLIVLALAGGWSVAGAIHLAARHAAAGIAPELRSLGEAMSRRGVVPALAADRGSLRFVSTALVTATASGAPVVPALAARLAQERHTRHTESVEAVRRLPVKLLVPLTLLVLPGFVLITVGPTVVDSLARLGS